MWNVVATEKIMQTSPLYSRHPSSQKTICDFSCYPAFCFNVDQITISWSNCNSTKNTFEPVRFFLKLSSFERRAHWALLLTGLSAPRPHQLVCWCIHQVLGTFRMTDRKPMKIIFRLLVLIKTCFLQFHANPKVMYFRSKLVSMLENVDQRD